MKYSASFLPEQTWAYKVSSRGFMQHQVRLMMGQPIALERRWIHLEDIRNSLSGENTRPLKSIAPVSGLMLNQVEFHGTRRKQF